MLYLYQLLLFRTLYMIYLIIRKERKIISILRVNYILNSRFKRKLYSLRNKNDLFTL